MTTLVLRSAPSRAERLPRAVFRIVCAAAGTALIAGLAQFTVYLPAAVVGLPVLAPNVVGGHDTGIRVLSVSFASAGYLWGIPWLMASLGVGAQQALALGLYPFVVGDTIKLLLAAGLLPAAWALVRRYGPEEGGTG